MAIDAPRDSTVCRRRFEVGLEPPGAVVLWVVGRWLIKLVSKLETRALSRQQLDATVINYIGSSLGVLLNIVLVVALRVGILPVLHFLWLRERYGLRCHWVLRLPRGTYIKVRHAASMPEFIRLEWYHRN